MIGNSNRHIYLGGYDVSKYVLTTKIPTSQQNKPEWGELPAITKLEFDLLNDTGIFSNKGTKSLFNNLDITTVSCKVTMEQGSNETIEWDGFIENIEEDHKARQTTITGITNFSKELDSPALITIGANTPSEVSRLLFELYNIEVDDSAYSTANALLSGFVQVQLDPNLLDSQITLMEAQKQLATSGYGRIYTLNGKMIYEVYNPTQANMTLISIGERQIMGEPKITKETRKSTPYTVETLFGQTQSAGWFSGSNSKNLDFGANSSVKCTSLSAGQQIADQWEAIDKLNTIRVEFPVLDNLGIMLDLRSYIQFTYTPINVFNQVMEIIGIDRTDPKYTKLVGRLEV